MAVVTFDTLKLARRLEAAGFPPKQAADTAEALSETIGEIGQALVTREYFDATLTARLAETKAEILRWMFGALVAQTALIVASVKVIH